MQAHYSGERPAATSALPKKVYEAALVVKVKDYAVKQGLVFRIEAVPFLGQDFLDKDVPTGIHGDSAWGQKREGKGPTGHLPVVFHSDPKIGRFGVCAVVEDQE